MYVPDGAESQLPGPKPELQHQNTRLKTQPFDYAKNKEAISALARNQVSSYVFYLHYFFCFTLYFRIVVTREREPGNLILRYSIPIKTLPLPTFCRSFEA